MSTTKPGVWMDAIPGGYRRIPTVDLCRIWTMHLEGQLKRLDLRVWFALHEMAERRCTFAKGRTPRFRIEEVVHLLGDVQEPAARAAVRRLHRAGVCSAKRSTIRFERPSRSDVDHLAPMLSTMPRRKAWLHVPRRVLRQLATGCSRGETAVLLGSVVRCVFLHRGEGKHRVDGRVPATWVSRAFGVSERAVIGARKRLLSLGWLKELASPGWSVARFGKRLMLGFGSAGGWVQPEAGSAWARQTRHFLRKIQQELARRARMGWEGRRTGTTAERTEHGDTRRGNGAPVAVRGPDPQAAAHAPRDGRRGDAQRRASVRAARPHQVRQGLLRPGLG